ncbi:MAG: hypothetical protein Q8928_01475 [Bacteroidota bacterium]|nr:hypothetical protein [Bacteroidota bacterium]
MKAFITRLAFILFLFSSVNTLAQTVYVTRTGAKYHAAGCHYLSRSCYAIDYKKAVQQGYTACKICKPSVSKTATYPSSSSEKQYRSSTPRENKAQAQQCTATTQKGTRCKRTTTNANGRCWQHQ